MNDTVIIGVQDGLSALILSVLWTHHGEQHHPGFDADNMDRKIETTAEVASKLRHLREQFEDIVAEYRASV